MERTEEQKLARDPLRVILGGKEFDIPLLVIKDSREWRRKASELLAALPGYANTSTDDPDQFKSAMNALMVAMPEQVIDLFFLYAKGLKQDEIEAVANDLELAEAFKQVAAIAFPFVGAVTTLAERLQ